MFCGEMFCKSPNIIIFPQFKALVKPPFQTVAIPGEVMRHPARNRHTFCNHRQTIRV